MPSPSKTKGSSYEREVAALLSEMYDAPFVRVPNSGAYIGGANTHRKTFLDSNQAKSFKGDIIAPDTWVKFNCECKNYRDFPWHQLLGDKCILLEAWLEQLLAVADSDDFNILAMKFNRKGSYIAVEKKHHGTIQVPNNHISYTSPNYGSWLIVESKTFWSLNKEIVKTLCKTN